MTGTVTAVALPTARGGGSAPLAGTRALTRLALRRDRVMIPIWAVALGGSFASVAQSFVTLYDTAAKRAAYAGSMNASSSLRALYGPVFADSVGGLTAYRMAGFGSALAAVMSVLIVVRHTREEEETGRQEMLSSAAVGRRAPLTSALLTALVANLAVAVVTVSCLRSSGDTTGALALALVVAGVGTLFACTAAIIAQITENARLARGLSIAVIGAAFVLKAAGDAAATNGSSVLTWFSPLGWAENVRAYAGERWWVLLIVLAAIGVQAGVAYTLAGRRDVGMSFLSARPGPASGSLSTAGALAWRLQRGGLFGWGAGFVVTGLIFGSLTTSAADLVGGNAGTQQIIERMGGSQGLTDSFLAALLGMLGMVAPLYTVSSVLRMHGEETSQRAEPILAGAVGRLRWAAGHLVVAFCGAAVVMVLGGLGLYAGYGRAAGPILAAALVQLPAVWVLGALAFAVYGFFPRAAVAGWAAAGLALAIGWIGPALDLPQGVMDVSPFGHLPKLPGGDMTWTPVVTLTLIAAALVAAGLVGLRRRDLES